MFNKNITILLVEDESVMALLLTNTLQKEGFVVIHAISGEAALNIVNKDGKMIDLILMDIELDTDVDGIQTAATILNSNDIPVLFLSAHAEKDILEQMENVSSYGFVHKNSGSFVLVASIKMALRLHDANVNLVKWKQAIEYAEWGVAVSTPDGQMFDVINPAFSRMLGFSRDELRSMNIRDVFASECRDDLTRQISVAYEKGHHTFESMQARKDGSMFPVLVDFSVLRDQKGNLFNIVVNVKDITSHKTAEAKLIEREARFRAIVENSGAGYFRIAADGKMKNANSAWLKMYGYKSLGDIKGRDYADFIHEDDRSAFQEILGSVMRGEPIKSGEFRRACKDGIVGYNSYTVNPVVHKGRVEGVEGFLIDTTASRHIENELYLHGEILKNLSEGVYLIRASDARIAYANPKFESMFGYEPGDLIGRHVSVLNAAGSKSPEEKAMEVLESLKKNGSWKGEIDNVRKDGSVFTCHASVSTYMHHKFGEVWISIHQDITESRKAEEALRESQAKLSAIIENSKDAIGVFKESVISFVNPAFVKMFGYEAEKEMLGKSVHDIISTGQHFVIDEYLAIQGGGGYIPREFEMRCRRKDGSEFDAEIHLSSYELFGELQILTILRDITDKRELEKEIINISENERRTIGSNLHDDLGQKLSYLGFIVEMIRQEMKKGAEVTDKEFEEVVSIISNTIEHVRSISKGLHPVSFESGGFIYAIEELAAEARKYFNIDVIIEKDYDININDEKVTMHLYYIIKEALNNSIKHGSSDKILLAFSHDKGILNIQMINKPKKNRIIKERPMGLGLRIMKYRAELIGASLKIINEEGRFQISISLKI